MPPRLQASPLMFISALAVAGAFTPLARAETLADAVRAAYITSPALRAQRDTQRAIDEDAVQARSRLQPSVGLTAGALHSAAPIAAFNELSASGMALMASQPLYTGGRASHEVAAADAQVTAGQHRLRAADTTLLRTVIQTYVDVRRDLDRVKIAEESARVLLRQRTEVEANFRVSIVTRTDVAQTDARLAAAETQVAVAQAQQAMSEDKYRALVGHSPVDLAPEPPLAHLLPLTLDAALQVAARRNPMILQSEAIEKASAARFAAAKTLSRPTVSLRAGLGYIGGGLGSGSPFRDYRVYSSAAVVVTLPLMSGGVIASEVRQAAARNSVARDEIEDAQRQAQQSVSLAWRELQAARAAVRGSANQVRAASLVWAGTRREADFGLRTTLDILNAEQALREAEFGVVTARRDEYVAAVTVLAAMGALDVADWSPETEVYDPAVNLAAVRRAARPVPWSSVVEALDELGADVSSVARHGRRAVGSTSAR
jgi:outer membrane protein